MNPQNNPELLHLLLSILDSNTLLREDLINIISQFKEWFHLKSGDPVLILQCGKRHAVALVNQLDVLNLIGTVSKAKIAVQTPLQAFLKSEKYSDINFCCTA